MDHNEQIKLTVNEKLFATDKIKIKNCTELICNNINLLNVISDIENVEDKDKKTSSDELNENKRYEKILFRRVITGDIKDINEGKNFIESYKQLSDEEKGDLLEDIVFTLGPFDKGLSFNKKLSGVKVKETGLKNSFDVVFFEKYDDYSEPPRKGDKESRIYKYQIYGEIEFSECKKNIANKIPVSQSKNLDSQMEKQLEFMRCVFEWRPDCNYYIPTYCNHVKPQEQYLRSYEDGLYNFVKILNVQEVKRLLS